MTSVCASRRVPWAVKEMIEEEKRKDDELPFIKKKRKFYFLYNIAGGQRFLIIKIKRY